MADETMIEAPAVVVDADPAVTAAPDVIMNEGEEKIKLDKAVRQIEFYFADSNLPYDRFMWTLHAKDAEHWIPLDIVTSFKRMREYAPLLAKIPDALRASELLEVDEAGKQVRRRTEPKEPVGQFERSVYADLVLRKKTRNSNPVLEDFFQFYGNTNEVRMRRDEHKRFKGSVFVEFTEMSGVETFLNADPKPTWEGKELVIMSKEDYCQMKVKEKGLTGKAAQFRKDLITRRKFDAFKNMENEKKTNEGKKEVEKKDIYLDKGVGTVKEEEIPFVKGAYIEQPIRDLFEGQTPFIKYQRGDNHGLDITKVKDGVKKLEDQDLTLVHLLAEEEKAFQIERAQVGGSGSPSEHGGRRTNPRKRAGWCKGRSRTWSRTWCKEWSGRLQQTGERLGRMWVGEDGPEQAGEKRKRAVEPDGGPDVGVRGVGGPPAVQSTKKVKIEGGEADSAP
ncbi:uncharacterized protein EV420DRAFT_1622634 [Desarmillaria tabescens]|uniref:HTH La-type RNA-binding domain-containing protein n=1 Tax=Armillaria tabescens TaxID=1929756 RepID=A0AA39JN69_ARMTA|nr:uncharacterized protein EV420DRAFT_1622634 [Desarmillaria tabescens]KAK0445634.1 hypothetical protein EV420DRAFT_1622634 [Desarmillaria tabescens]